MLYPLIFAISVSTSFDDQDQNTIEALRAGLQVWTDRLEYKCKFELYVGNATTLDKALSGDMDVASYKLLSGLMARSGRLSKLVARYTDKHMLVDDNNKTGHSTYKFMNDDTISNGHISVIHTPAQGAAFLSGSAVADDMTADTRLSSIPSPSNPLSGPNETSPIVPENYINNLQYEWELKPLSKNKLYLYVKDTKTQVQCMELLVSTEYNLPVPLKIIVRDGSYTNYVALDKFTKSGSSVAPRLIVSAGRVAGAALYDVEKWISGDLGESMPTGNDFELRLGPNELLVNLKNYRRSGVERVIDVAKLTAADLGECLLAPPGDAKPQKSQSRGSQSRGSSWLPVLMVYSGLIMIFIMEIVCERYIKKFT